VAIKKGLMEKYQVEEAEGEEEEVEKHGSEHHSSESDGEDVVEDLPIATLKAKTNMRTSVSAEAFGDHNQKKVYVPIVVPKSGEIKA